MKVLLFIFLIMTCSVAGYSQAFMFVFLNKKEHAMELPKEELSEIMEGHMANINQLAKEGKLLIAGPFEGGGGIFIFRSNSRTQVEEWLSTDPGVKARRWGIEIFNYQPSIGSVCAVTEPYEMIQYHFIRYTINVTKYTISQLPAGLDQHEQFLKKLELTGNVVASGALGEEEGTILILKGEIRDDLFVEDPAVQKNFLEFERRKLYIAKGSFCEK